VGEMRYKIRIRCREGFQLFEPSDLGIYLEAITLMVTNFSTASYMLQSLKIISVTTRRSGLSKSERLKVEDLA
jgi:hypothetical protein